MNRSNRQNYMHKAGNMAHYEYLYKPAHIGSAGLGSYACLNSYYLADANAKSGSLVDRITRDDRQALKEKVYSLAGQIERRWTAYEENMYSLNTQECIVSTIQDNLQSEWAYTTPKRIQGFESERAAIRKEIRGERIKVWDDVRRLETELLDAVHRYKASSRDREIISGDTPW